MYEKRYWHDEPSVVKKYSMVDDFKRDRKENLSEPASKSASNEVEASKHKAQLTCKMKRVISSRVPTKKYVPTINDPKSLKTYFSFYADQSKKFNNLNLNTEGLKTKQVFAFSKSFCQKTNNHKNRFIFKFKTKI
jgi:hypothetical protein